MKYICRNSKEFCNFADLLVRRERVCPPGGHFLVVEIIQNNNMHMFKKKSFSTDQAYAAPLSETLEVRFEGVMCQSFSSKGTEHMSTDAAEDF